MMKLNNFLLLALVILFLLIACLSSATTPGFVDGDHNNAFATTVSSSSATGFANVNRFVVYKDTKPGEAEQTNWLTVQFNPQISGDELNDWTLVLRPDAFQKLDPYKMRTNFTRTYITSTAQPNKVEVFIFENGGTSASNNYLSFDSFKFLHCGSITRDEYDTLSTEEQHHFMGTRKPCESVPAPHWRDVIILSHWVWLTTSNSNVFFNGPVRGLVPSYKVARIGFNRAFDIAWTSFYGRVHMKYSPQPQQHLVTTPTLPHLPPHRPLLKYKQQIDASSSASTTAPTPGQLGDVYAWNRNVTLTISPLDNNNGQDWGWKVPYEEMYLSITSFVRDPICTMINLNTGKPFNVKFQTYSAHDYPFLTKIPAEAATGLGFSMNCEVRFAVDGPLPADGWARATIAVRIHDIRDSMFTFDLPINGAKIAGAQADLWQDYQQIVIETKRQYTD